MLLKNSKKTYFVPKLQGKHEIDVNYDNTAGNYHIFVPNVTAAIASKYLYAFTTTAVSSDITAGRFTVELEYSVY